MVRADGIHQDSAMVRIRLNFGTVFRIDVVARAMEWDRGSRFGLLSPSNCTTVP